MATRSPHPSVEELGHARRLAEVAEADPDATIVVDGAEAIERIVAVGNPPLTVTLSDEAAATTGYTYGFTSPQWTNPTADVSRESSSEPGHWHRRACG